REEFDPDYDGPLQAGIPFCQPGTPSCDADYDLGSRPRAVRDALGKVALHGNIGRPLITLHGTLDSLLPIRTDSDVYDRMVAQAGRGARHRYYVIEHGNHVDGRYDLFPDRLRPILPCYRTAFVAMERWVETGEAPPASQFVPDRRGGGDIVNECPIARTGAGTGPSLPTGARVKPRGLTLHVAPRRDRRKPFRFRVRGRVLLPRGVRAARVCGSGTVRVRVRRRHRTVATRRRPIGRRCHYRARVRSRHGRLHFGARFSGNRALRAVRARGHLARAG
ncbi:MAG: hypothetical protein QOG63_894, partial [Thermoleophilaceae bacterium]|nr:hypothetical protein [Thermoleophilaceae bacterium]